MYYFNCEPFKRRNIYYCNPSVFGYPDFRIVVTNQHSFLHRLEWLFRISILFILIWYFFIFFLIIGWKSWHCILCIKSEMLRDKLVRHLDFIAKICVVVLEYEVEIHFYHFDKNRVFLLHAFYSRIYINNPKWFWAILKYKHGKCTFWKNIVRIRDINGHAF